ncbi:MAG: hypothetical protein IKW33_00635 [Clostridia bacterium]|nr:hypothetical protein [Clostridia bacterium]
MKVLKKLFIMVCALSFLTLIGCSNQLNLSNYVSQLKSNIYEGTFNDLTVMANYGFIEDNSANDGVVNKTNYYLTVKLLNKQTDYSTYTLKFCQDGNEYEKKFELNPISNSFSATIFISPFSANSFEITIINSSTQQVVKLNSILPKNTLTPEVALKKLQEQQPSLIKNYLDENGNFKAEIIQRVLVKDNHPYYYVGIVENSSNTKAMLLDGFTGEVLAIRNVF